MKAPDRSGRGRRDELAYTITFENVLSRSPSMRAALSTNPILPEILYLEGTAFGSGTTITFSIDGSEPRTDSIEITDSNGGTHRQRVGVHAHRWTFEPALEPGQRGSVSFRGRLRDGRRPDQIQACTSLRTSVRRRVGLCLLGASARRHRKEVWLRPWLASETDPARVPVLPGIRVRVRRARPRQDLRKTRFKEQGPVMDGWP